MKKWIKRIFIAFITIIILAMGTFAWFAKSNSKNWGDNSKILKSNIKNENKKALVVYQPSRGKITNKVAEKFAKGMNDLGYEVTINYPGSHMPADLSKYSIIVFGSPIYIGETSSVLSEYMSSVKGIENKKIYLFATGGQINNDELSKMEVSLGKIKATEKLEFKNGTKDEDKAYEIGKRIAGE